MRRILIAIAAVCLLQGCVEFERQSLVYRHDTDRDELRILMIYEGIYAENARDVGELRSLLLRPRTFLFSNWIMEYDRDAWLRALDELRQDKSPNHPASTAAQIRLRKLGLDNIRVENGKFYLNDRNKLAAWQQVTITNVTALLSAANEAINAALLAGELQTGDLPLASADSAQFILDAAAANHNWLQLTDGQWRVRLPLAPEDYTAFLAEADDTWPSLTRAGFRRQWRTGVAELIFGTPHVHNSLVLDVFDGPYQPNLVTFVEDQGLMDPGPDFDQITRVFINRKLR